MSEKNGPVWHDQIFIIWYGGTQKKVCDMVTKEAVWEIASEFSLKDFVTIDIDTGKIIPQAYFPYDGNIEVKKPEDVDL
jgi:hypothetical protein